MKSCNRWLRGKNTTVDFDQSLSTAINKIREALGDSAENPRFVETLSRKGYRFIAPVNTSEQESLTAISAAHSQSAIPTVAPANPTSSKSGKARDAAPGWYTSPVLKRTSWIAVAAFGITVLAALGLGYLLGSRKQHIGAALPMRLLTDSGRIESASSIMESFPATVTDGVHLYATAIEEGRSILVQVSTMDGSMHPLTVPDEVVGPGAWRHISRSLQAIAAQSFHLMKRRSRFGSCLSVAAQRSGSQTCWRTMPLGCRMAPTFYTLPATSSLSHICKMEPRGRSRQCRAEPSGFDGRRMGNAFILLTSIRLRIRNRCGS